MKSLIPLIVVILLLTGAITYTLSKSSLPKQVTKQESVSPNELEVDSFVTPTATPTVISIAKVTPTPTAIVTPKTSEDNSSKPVDIVPTITVKPANTNTENSSSDGSTAEIVTTKVNKNLVCTPVYGMADSCVEHITVDTAGEDMVFLNLAGLSYLLGLGAFVKAKRA